MKTQITNNVSRVVRENNSLSSFLQSLQTEKPTTKQSILYDERPLDPRMRKMTGEDILTTWVHALKTGLSPEQNGNSDDQIFLHRVWELEESQFEKYGPQGGHPPMAEVWEEIYGSSFSDMPEMLRVLFDQEYVSNSLVGDGAPADRFICYPSQADAVAKRISEMALAELLYLSGLNVDNEAAFMIAVQNTINMLKSNRVWNLVPANPASVVADLLAEGKLTTNSGYPLFSTRRDPNVIKGSLEAVANGDYVWYPAIPLFRYYNGKLRGVWMYPFAVNIKEATVVRPFMRAVQKSKLVEDGFFAPWKGFNAVKQLISKKYISTKAYVAATDYSSTDKHFNLSYSIICAYVLASTYKSEYRWEVFANVLRMHTIPLVISSEEMLCGSHGVASGSELTNLIETIGGAIQGEYESVLSHARIYGLYGIGDDMCHMVDASIDGGEFKDFVARVGAQINQEIKAEKVTASEEYVKSLQRLMQRGYYVPGNPSLVRGVYPTVRALKSIVYPERYHKKAYNLNGDLDPYDKMDFCSRVYQILENTCDHPMFSEFVAFVIAGNEDLAKFVMMDSYAIDRYYERSKRLSGLVDTYNVEYSDRKMSQFLSVQEARRLLREDPSLRKFNVKVAARSNYNH